MDWFGGRVSLGNLDLSGAVNKLSESVKNIEKNFDSALGFEEKSESSSSQGPSTDATNRKVLLGPALDFMAQKGEEAVVEGIIADLKAETESPEEIAPSIQDSPSVEKGIDADRSPKSETVERVPCEEESPLPNDQKDHSIPSTSEETPDATESPSAMNSDSHLGPTEVPEFIVENVDTTKSAAEFDEKDKLDEPSSEISEPIESKEETAEAGQPSNCDKIDSGSNDSDAQEKREEKSEQPLDGDSSVLAEASSDRQLEVQAEPSHASSDSAMQSQSPGEFAINVLHTKLSADEAAEMLPERSPEEPDSAIGAVDVKEASNDAEVVTQEPRLSTASTASDHVDSSIELEKVKREMKMMEAALQGAARQAQAKADEIARLMGENEHLKSVVEDLRRKPNEAEIESLREEYHQRVATLERKVYALTKERDTLRREQSKKSDAAALLKEKDEIINQIMAEGEELSKKQATQEATIRKLRAQVRELEEEKKGLNTKLQVEENKVESIKKDKAATEKLLQETIERHQAELTAQKAYYTDALNAAKEAEALAEARANNEARTELESRLREAEEREAMLVQALEELRQTLSRQEQQAAFREDMLRRDMEDLQQRYQASERRCEELVTQVPDSTRPLLRQIEAMQETYARRDEAWAAVERNLNSRLQEAEARAAAAEERERSVNERLSQTLSRINVLEAQISCLRAEQTQLARSLEKERQRAAENRQEYLAAKEDADTHEGRVNQLEEELKELKRKHKQELQESLAHRELLQQEVEREKTARLELEKINSAQPPLPDQNPTTKIKSPLENGRLMRKLSSASSVGNIEESFFLQASLEPSDNVLERRNSGEVSMSPYHLKSMTPSAFEATLRQKEGELSSYMSRLASMESIRDSLAEELVKMTEQCDKLRTEAATLPGIRAELEALRRRHTAALELMGERDEELEELRADIVDLKEMYREQVNLLVNKIQILSSQMGNT